MYLRDINLENIVVKKRIGRNTGKIYYSGKKLSYKLSNVIISKVSGSIMYVKVDTSDLQMHRSLEDHIENNILHKEISESNYLNSNVFINRHKQNLVKIVVDFDTSAMPSASSEKMYDIDVKCAHLTFNDDNTVNMDIHICDSSDIRLIETSDSETDTESEEEEAEAKTLDEEIGPTPDEVLQIRSDMLQKLNKEITSSDLEIKNLVVKCDKLKYYRQQLEDSSDINRILYAINEIDC
jgi:hypothetical protein